MADFTADFLPVEVVLGNVGSMQPLPHFPIAAPPLVATKCVARRPAGLVAHKTATPHVAWWDCPVIGATSAQPAQPEEQFYSAWVSVEVETVQVDVSSV